MTLIVQVLTGVIAAGAVGNLMHLSGGRSSAAVALYRLYVETLPFAWAVWLLAGVHEYHAGDMTDVIIDTALAVCFYFTWRGSDDDRWKKRRKRALSQIRQIGDRLIIEPLPA